MMIPDYEVILDRGPILLEFWALPYARLQAFGALIYAYNESELPAR